MSGRNTRDIPDQSGRTAVVSGAAGGTSPPARTLLAGALDPRRPGGRTAVDGVAAADRGVVRRDDVTT
ncbi:hypothetical protein [Streptomyces phaeoluteigriseus]|uniref:hypothetical protein n=1 Tax=Streptomyces phaeoluteigriseus TaxID=114686 RepID=UPI003EB7945E